MKTLKGTLSWLLLADPMKGKRPHLVLLSDLALSTSAKGIDINGAPSRQRFAPLFACARVVVRETSFLMAIPASILRIKARRYLSRIWLAFRGNGSYCSAVKAVIRKLVARS